MKIIAVDDEALQLETVVEYLKELYPEAEIHGFQRASELLKYMEAETADVAILDISMPGNINGINLGNMLRQKNKRIKILYCTGFSEYAMEAYNMHANGYLRKPIKKDELKQELRYVLQMPVFGEDKKPYIHTFGNFDVFVGGRPVPFKRKKAKEILAYLTDREGGWVTNRELVAALWDEPGSDSAFSKYVTLLVKEMISDLEEAGAGYIVERKRGMIRLLRGEVTCDYYEYLAGDRQAKAKFHLEYMSQYSWGEATLASIMRNRST